jgi:hypothetical protein
MKKPSKKTLLKKLFSDLEWPILESPTDMPMTRIVSDPRNKSHFVYRPEKANDKGTDLDVLHELGHASLCERVHPAFATNSQFPALANKKQFLQMLPALSTGADWFVCHWQQELLPEEMHQVIRESLPTVEEILGKEELPPVEIILDSALLIAQAVHYLGEPIECGGPLQDLVEAFLSTPPDEPSAENLTRLINKLMATYSEQRVQLVPEAELMVWDIKKDDAPLVQTVTAP